MSFSKSDILLIFNLRTTLPDKTAYKATGRFLVSGYDEREKENRVHRIVADSSSGVYFGYDLVIKPFGIPGKHLVSVQSLSITPLELFVPSWGSTYDSIEKLTERRLPKYPEDLIVEDGDTIALDILHNPATKVKIVDSIKITTKRPQDFTPNEVKLRLTSPKLLENGILSSHRGSEWLGVIEGSIISVYIPGKGRFIFSLYPQSGLSFEKTAVIEDSKIAFHSDRKHYEVTSDAPILNSGGSWTLWVLHDSDYRPDLVFGPTAGGFIEYAASNEVETLLKQEWRKSRILPARPLKEIYSDWLGEVRYIITDAEKQTFSQLKSEDEREHFINSFWKSRDTNPETKENEFRREYYSRIAYANESFGWGKTPGWITDRGSIWITYGKPDEVQKTALKETWLYNSLSNPGGNIRFEFRVDIAKGDFRLQQ